MGCNCGRKRAVLQAPPPGGIVNDTAAETMVANAEVREMPQSTTDPATGTVRSEKPAR